MRSSEAPEPGAPASPGEWRALAVVALLAAALRTAAALRLGLIMADGPIFIRLAQDMAAGDWATALAHDYHPLYSLLLWGVHGLVGGADGNAGWVVAGCVVSVVSGVVAVVALWALLRDAFGARTAWMGAGLLAIHPYAVDFSSDVQSDGLYMALFLVATALCWSTLRRGRLSTALAAGVVAGVGYLARPEAVGVLLVTAVIGGLHVLRRGWSAPRAAACTAALALGFGLAAAPYLVAMRDLHGGWSLTQKKSVAAVALVDGQQAASQPGMPGDQRGASSSLTPLLAPLGPAAAAAGEVAGVTLQSLRFDVLLLLLVGAWSVRGRPGLRALFFVGLAGAYIAVEYGLQLSAGYSSKRHTFPPMTPLLGYAALGIPVVGDWLVRGLRPLWPRGFAHPAAGVALVAALLLSWNLPRDLERRRAGDVALRHAAEWLRAENTRGAGVASHRARVAFYADAPYVSLRAVQPEAGASMVDQLRAFGAGYVIVDDRDLQKRPDWRPMIELLPVLHETTAYGRHARVLAVPRAADS